MVECSAVPYSRYFPYTGPGLCTFPDNTLIRRAKECTVLFLDLFSSHFHAYGNCMVNVHTSIYMYMYIHGHMYIHTWTHMYKHICIFCQWMTSFSNYAICSIWDGATYLVCQTHQCVVCVLSIPGCRVGLCYCPIGRPLQKAFMYYCYSEQSNPSTIVDIQQCVWCIQTEYIIHVHIYIDGTA